MHRSRTGPVGRPPPPSRSASYSCIPAPAAAQECRTRPGCVAAAEPSVTLTPASGSAFTGTAPEHRLVVTISWCDDGALDLASRRVRVDSVDLPATEFVPVPSCREAGGQAIPRLSSRRLPIV